MAQTIPSKVPGGVQIVVRIENVDMVNRSVHCFEKTKGKIDVSFRDIPGGGLLRIPTQGERWTAIRFGHIWRLTGRLSSHEEQLEISALLQPGDSQLSTPGTLYLDVLGLVFNGRHIGTVVHDTYNQPGPFTIVTLSQTPAEIGTVMPYLNGLLCQQELWSLHGRTLTFGAPMGFGNLVVYYQSVGRAYDDSTVVSGRGRASGAESYTP